MPEKIVCVTAGGHISSFHAAFKAMHETLDKKASGRFELCGAWGGLEGLAKGDIRPIKPEHIEENRAGSLIGADRNIIETDRISRAIRENDVQAVIMMGGDNHMKEGDKLHDLGVKVVGYPKTMDGDLSSFITLGWDTAVYVGATKAREHHHTAMTSRRIFYVGLFGRNTDWIVTCVGVYGGADRCIPCEKPYHWQEIFERIKVSVNENEQMFGIPFAVVPYSEGAKIWEFKDTPHQYQDTDVHGLPKLQPELIGLELVRLTKGAGYAAAFEAHTYSMRDSPPTEADKTLSRMAGEECINMILENDFGKSVVFEPEADFFAVHRKLMQDVAVQRKVSETDFFDYEILKPTKSFVDTYGNLFNRSLGKPPQKEELVYKNLL